MGRGVGAPLHLPPDRMPRCCLVYSVFKEHLQPDAKAPSIQNYASARDEKGVLLPK